MSLQVFRFGESEVRTIIDEFGIPWWIAADVCRVLGIANSRDAVGDLDDDEKGVASTDTLGGSQRMATVNESGLYTLILRSRKPEAKAFKRWVTKEVLPAIHRTGMYQMKAAPTLPQTYTEALRALLAEVEAKEKLQMESAKQRPMVEFYHAVAASSDTLSLNDAAKVLGIGRNKMMAQMRAYCILNRHNIPYQEYIDRKLFRVTESHWTDKDGATHIQKTTRVYQRGIEYLRRRFGVRELAVV